MSKALQVVQSKYGTTPARPSAQQQQLVRNLGSYLAPVQLQRLRQDVQMWRRAVQESENIWWPFRVRMQQIFIDTILNGHVGSVMERRKDLSLLREFHLCDKNGKTIDDLTKLFEADWFYDFLSYSLDGLFFGYSLISLGDAENNAFPHLSIIQRWNVSPDRLLVATTPYNTNGICFAEEPYSDWHIWVKTPTETGAVTCGYGLFYKIALYEIFLRNTLGYNGDFVELYSQPYRVGKTNKSDEAERAQLEEAVRNMGSSGYAIIDPQDDISFLETALGGTGWQGYDNLEMRCEKKVSKLILGHADAVDSTPGKLGGGQSGKGDHGGGQSPVAQALADKQSKDGRFLHSIVNNQLIPKMRKIGFIIPDAVRFEFKKDSEQEMQRQREDASNKATADIAETLSRAGLEMDTQYFTDRTSIPVTKAAPAAPPTPQVNDPGISNRIKNRLDQIYNQQKP